MAKAQFKLLIFLITLGLASGCVAMAYWIWVNIIHHEQLVQQDIAELKSAPAVVLDPGARRFDAAIDLIREGQIQEGRQGLYKLLQQFPESPTCSEAKRIIGEINLDQLFSADLDVFGKRDYIVQPGDSLALIASKQSTTVSSLIRLNALADTMLHPGDHLTVAPMDFSLMVDVSARTVTLLRIVGDKEVFFKEYQAYDVQIPESIRIPTETTLGGKSASINGQYVTSADHRYIEAEKWLPAMKTGVILRTLPVAKAVPIADEENGDAPASAPATPVGGATTTTLLPSEAAAAPTETGVFLASEDLEELFALVNKGAKLRIVR